MHKLSTGKILVSYLRENRRILVLAAGGFCITWGVFALYRLPSEPVLYAALLCFVYWLPGGIAGFVRYRRRVQTLWELQRTITVDTAGLPETASLPEELYQQLVQELAQDRRRIEQREQAARDEMVDYYTLWAHQVKTPISAMRLLLQTNENELTDELRPELFRIEGYVQMVLSYLRLEGPNDFVLRRCPLEGIVRQAVRKYAPLFIRQKITLELRPIRGNVLTDEKWLVFVLEQLLSNALKYTAKGRISICMAGENQLVIEDTGIGIAPEDLPRVGEKGFTGCNGRRQKQATGLGLYLCRKILDRLSHTMTFESEIGRGTRVTLDLNSEPLTAE